MVRENEPQHDKTNNMACAPSLIRIFTVRSMGSWWPNVPSCGHWRLWSDWADAQADLSLRWAHMPFCRFCHEAAQMWFVLDRWYSINYAIVFSCSQLCTYWPILTCKLDLYWITAINSIHIHWMCPVCLCSYYPKDRKVSRMTEWSERTELKCSSVGK